MTKPKREKFTTAAGTAVYPWLNRPDTKEFDGKPAKPAYKVSLRLGGEAAAALKARIDAKVDEAYDDQVAKFKDQIQNGATGKEKGEAKKKLETLEKAYPYEPAFDDDGEETGETLFKFKQNAVITRKDGSTFDVKLPLFDSQGRKMSENIFGGSTIKVNFSMRTYWMASTNKAGTTLDLNAVQVIELVTSGGGSADAFGFGAEEGGFETSGEDYSGKDRDEGHSASEDEEQF